MGSKGKRHPRTGHERPEGECRYGSIFSLTSVPDRGGWSTPRPLPPLYSGKQNPAPSVQEPERARDSLYGAENLALTEIPSSDRPALSESPY